MKNLLKIIILFLIIIFIFGCKSIPFKKINKIPNDKALIYFYVKSNRLLLGGAVLCIYMKEEMFEKLNNKNLYIEELIEEFPPDIQMHGGEYYPYITKPGFKKFFLMVAHKPTLFTDEFRKQIEINIEPSKIYYYRVIIPINIFQNYSIALVDVNTAEQEIRKCSFAGNTEEYNRIMLIVFIIHF